MNGDVRRSRSLVGFVPVGFVPVVAAAGAAVAEPDVVAGPVAGWVVGWSVVSGPPVARPATVAAARGGPVISR